MRTFAFASVLLLGAHGLTELKEGPAMMSTLEADAALHQRLVEELLHDVVDLGEGPRGTRCGQPINPTNDRGERPSLICKSSITKIQAWSRGAHERILSTGGSTTAGKVFCKEACQGCKVASDVRECATCPCTVMDPTANVYGYMMPVLNSVSQQCAWNQHFNVLHIGLGSGGTVHAVNKICKTEVVRIVEYQADVIYLSNSFLGLNAKQVAPEMLTANPGMEVTQADGEMAAALMAEKMPRTFDRIVVDCMNNGYIPEGCKSPTLYASFRKLLRPRGVVSQWTWPQQINEVAATMRETFGNSVPKAGWVTSHV